MKKYLPLIVFLFLSLSALSQPKLNSYPQAPATIFLDFDGQFVEATSWNGGASFYCAPSGLSEVQITEIFHRVSEDYRPFNVNVTTDSTVFLAAPLNQRIRVIITPTSSWYPGVGGVAFTRSFTWGDGTPAFVFPDKLSYKPKSIAECCSHETGHTLGLSHQAKYNGSCNLIATYNEGEGSGQTGWAPVMGNSYGRNFSGWNNGPTPSGCWNDQDNLSIITGINGFSYREDDHGDDALNSTKLEISGQDFSSEGVITTDTDKDVFKLKTNQQGRLELQVNPFSVGPNNAGANLDVKVTLLDSNYEIFRVYDPGDILNVSVDTVLSKGTYYLKVEGTGNQFATNYGSLGSYSLSGLYSPTTVTSVKKIELSGQATGGKHSLNWVIETDESMNKIELERSFDGEHFEILASLPSTERHFSSTPLWSEMLYYRIKVTTIRGAVSYSNTISLKAARKGTSLSILSNPVHQEVRIKATEEYQFILSDMQGKILKKGNAQPGINVINLENSPNGIYMIQMISNSQRITERIVKL